jgi:hypothetical protein
MFEGARRRFVNIFHDFEVTNELLADTERCHPAINGVFTLLHASRIL